jgi:hypothetical protein
MYYLHSKVNEVLGMNIAKRFLKNLFNSSPNAWIICFEIDNYEEVYRLDNEIINKLKTTLAEHGAIPTKIDFPSRLCCVELTNPSLEPKQVLNLLESLGFRATLITTETGDSKHERLTP